MAKRYSPALKRRAIRLYVGKLLSAAAVAAKLGLKVYTVKEWLTVAGVIRSMSEAAALSASNRPRARATSRLWYASKKTGSNHFAESSLEFLRMQQLDNDPSVTSWGRCRVRIPYTSPDGRRRHYIPDFKIEADIVCIEEIKPKAMLADPLNTAKFAACAAYCQERGWGFRVLTEVDVGYARSIAPHPLSKKERRALANETRRKLWANQTAEQRADRLAKNAAYMRKFNASRRMSAPQ